MEILYVIICFDEYVLQAEMAPVSYPQEIILSTLLGDNVIYTGKSLAD